MNGPSALATSPRNRFASALLVLLALCCLAPAAQAAYSDPCDPSDPAFDPRDCADYLNDKLDTGKLGGDTTSGGTTSYDYDSSTLDSDGDGVVDADDFCPTAESEAALGTAGEASLLQFFMGDSGTTTLLQNVGVSFSKALEGYDYSVMLKADDDLGFIEINAAAEDAVDLWYTSATQDNFFRGLREIVRRGYLVDVFIWAHGNQSGDDAYFTVADDGAYADEIWGGELEYYLAPERIGCGGRFAPIRMVYSGACYNSEMNDSWTAVGAKAVAGARYINFYPNQFGGFATAWADGETFRRSLDDADDASSRTLVQTYLQTIHLAAVALLEPIEFAWYCVFPDILDDTRCSEWYFQDSTDFGFDWLGETRWEMGGEFDEEESGRWNLNYSSEKLTDGDTSITRADVVFDWRAPIDLELDVEPVGAYVARSRFVVGTGTVRWYEVTYDLTVSNAGDHEAPDVTVSLAGSPAVSAAGLASSASVASPYPGYPTTVQLVAAIPLDSKGVPRTTTLTFTLDPAGVVNDPDRSNNSRVLTLSASDFRPDYTVDILSATRAGISFGSTRTYDVQCLVRNTGLKNAASASLVSVVDNIRKVAVTASVPALAVGSSSTQTVRVTAGTSSFLSTIITATADSGAAIPESDETNNTGSITVVEVDTGWMDKPQLLELDLMVEQAYEWVEPAVILEVFELIVDATDDCFMCDPWLKGSDELAFSPVVRSYLRSEDFGALVMLRSTGLLTTADFKTQATAQLVAFMQAY